MSTKTRDRRDDLYSFDKFIVRAHRSAAGTAWRWRTELLTLGGLGAALIWLTRQVGIHWAVMVLAAALGIVLALPWSRRFIIRRDTVAARHQVGTPLSRLTGVYAAFLDGEPVLQGVVIPRTTGRPRGRKNPSPLIPISTATGGPSAGPPPVPDPRPGRRPPP